MGNRLAIVLEADDSIPPGEARRVFEFLATRLIPMDGVRRVDVRPGLAREEFIQRHYPRLVPLYLEPGALVAAGERLGREAMDSALSAPRPARVPDAVAALARVPPDPLGLLRLAAQPMRAWVGVSRLRSVDGLVTLSGARRYFLVIEAERTHDDVEPATRLLASIDQLLETARNDPGLRPVLRGRRLSSTGLIGVSVSVTMRRDGARIAAASGLVVIVILAIFFRRVVAPLVVLLTLTTGLLLTGAAAALGYGSISLLAWMFTGLLVGLGDDYAVHISAQYWIHEPAGGGREAALAAALTRPGRGIVTSAFTSAAGFLSLTLIPYPYLRQVGILTALGLMAILLSSFVVLPLLLSFTRPGAAGGRHRRGAAMLTGANRSPSWRAALPWVLLVAAGLAVLPRVRFEPHPWGALLQGNPDAERLEALSREAGMAFSPVLLLSAGRSDEEALARDREAMRRLRPVALRAGIATIQSLAQWLPDPAHQRANLDYLAGHPDRFAPERIRRDFARAAARAGPQDSLLPGEYLPRILPALEPPHGEITLDRLRALGLDSEVDRHLVRHGGSHVAVSYLYLRELPWKEGVVARLTDVLREAGITGLPGVTLAEVRYSDARDIGRAVAKASLAGVAAVLLILWFEFRRPRYVLLCLAPLLCGVSATFLAMWLLDIPFNLVTAAIGPILVGIGVDDGIHMVERLRSGEEVGTVLREAGSNEIITTFTTVGAMGCLTLATIPAVRHAGLLGAIGLMTCLLASLHLVPWGWAVAGKRGSGAAGKTATAPHEPQPLSPDRGRGTPPRSPRPHG